jgi:hypothetical protein
VTETSIIVVALCAVAAVLIVGVTVSDVMTKKYNVRNVIDRCEVWHK